MTIENPTIEIFSQGEEVVSGQTVDTNAAWLSEELQRMGFNVIRHTTVGDQLDALVTLLKEISERVDCCICTGGLGPTIDDLTAEAVSQAFECPLIKDEEALGQIEKYFVQMGRKMPDANIKQAMLPQGAQRLDNDWGTAPGFCFQAGRCWFAFIPGVPFEMKKIFEQRITPALRDNFRAKPLRCVTLRCVGLGESDLQERLDRVAFPSSARVSFRTGALENQIKLMFSHDFPEVEVRRLAQKAEQAIGKSVFCIDGMGEQSGDLVAIIGQYLNKSQQTVAAVETVSGGKIAARCAGNHWFKESLVACEMKVLCDRYGVSLPIFKDTTSMGQTVGAIAEITATQTGADFALSQLWFEDYGALADRSTAVELYSALFTPQGIFRFDRRVGGNMPRKQTVASTIALDMLRRYFQGYL